MRDRVNTRAARHVGVVTSLVLLCSCGEVGHVGVPDSPTTEPYEGLDSDMRRVDPCVVVPDPVFVDEALVVSSTRLPAGRNARVDIVDAAGPQSMEVTIGADGTLNVATLARAPGSGTAHVFVATRYGFRLRRTCEFEVIPGPMCGDDTCDVGEDCASCAQDCGPCAPAAVAVAWDAPLFNTDGSPLIDLAGFHVYVDTASPIVRTRATVIDAGAAVELTLNLEPGTHYLGVSAYDGELNESAMSNEIVLEVP